MKTEYTLQFRFTPKGHWHTDDVRCSTEKEARTELSYALGSIEMRTKLGIPYAKYWRIVKREVGAWKECVE